MGEDSAIEYELTLLSRHFLHSQQRTPGTQLDRSGYLLLGRLQLEGPMSLRELAEAFRLDVSTVNRQVNALRRKQLVERVSDPEGGLARKVRATEKGLDLLEADRERQRSGLDRVIGAWGERDRRQLLRLLTRLNTDIEQLEGRPWPRPER